VQEVDVAVEVVVKQLLRLTHAQPEAAVALARAGLLEALLRAAATVSSAGALSLAWDWIATAPRA
jgi:hypothetical protein